MGEKTEFIEPGKDPYEPAYKKRKRIPFKWIAFTIIGVVAVMCCCGTYLVINVPRAQADASPEMTDTAEATLPPPGLKLTEPATPTASATGIGSPTKINAFTLLTQYAASPTPTETASPSHFLTQLVYDDLNMSATFAAAQPGDVINISGVDPKVTTIIILASDTPTERVITATPTATDHVVVETVVFERIITATPGPTWTPFFMVTSPPIVTVVVNQTVEVEVEVTREVTVVVTATATNTLEPTLTETPTP